MPDTQQLLDDAYQWPTIKKVMSVTGLSHKKVRNYIKDKVFQAVKFRGLWRINLDAHCQDLELLEQEQKRMMATPSPVLSPGMSLEGFINSELQEIRTKIKSKQ